MTTTRNQLGMIVFITSEAVFFALLVLSYAFFHKGGQGAEASRMLDPIKTGFFSIALLSSSLTMWLAEKAHEKKNYKGVALWLLATVILGAIFLIGQGIEYALLIHNHITISRNLFGSTFFTLTGFHGMHVLFGLLMLGVLTGLAFAGKKFSPNSEALSTIAIYWHFVDAVWIVIFGVVYMWSYLA